MATVAAPPDRSSTIEPRPKGNPGEIRAVAARIAALAADLQKTSSVALRVLPAQALIGPGRAEHDDAFRTASSHGADAARDMIAEAHMLDREADTLQHAQQDWDRRKADADRREREAQQKQCIADPRR